MGETNKQKKKPKTSQRKTVKLVFKLKFQAYAASELYYA